LGTEVPDTFAPSDTFASYPSTCPSDYLFGGFRKSIIYKEEELEEGITCAKFAHMGKEGDQPYEYTAL
jgi:hypothetical protein